ncbi:hypothetical protein CAPTEDRAFT_544 [Capitella teleta]|uniref:General transcription factor IIF subunit 2 n=1 Tax=Capitella teleta TaxID=283909 RepID=R7V3J0_CAPTE|nr:hypothetical protein CAPTEDRAFT_544 [Capitella teleta]|eukprot:ELU10906.1 hypothetical protein CAPTEDRAFT_544 [Capitella teleta]
MAGGKPEVIFSLDSRLAAVEDAEKNKVPKDHKFVLGSLGRQSLSVLSTVPSDKEPTDPSSSNEELSLEGKVIQRAECKPVADSNYMALKRSSFETSNNPARQVVHLDKAVLNYKPKSIHSAMVEMDNKPKDQKRMRMDKDRVMEMLFSAFEKHQYYNLKDLVKITDQPVVFLKEILREIGNYNMKAPHKNMWELKSEFRHYKDDKPSTSAV